MMQCYNRGCGQTYDPEKNTEESCRYHPGMPFFHDAYKGWSCCKKKTVNFTEFLNVKGCTLGKHSNIKPPEPEKPPKSIEMNEDEVVVRKPILTPRERPSFDSTLTKITPTVLPALKEDIDSLKIAKAEIVESESKEIPIGTMCKNSGCKCSYSSPDSEESECQYHSGVPIFHEGLKFWSCCSKRTTDFTTFMNQPGCTYGNHKWKENDDKKTIICRYDWHQTPSDVIVAIYAKMYHYEKSSIELNPVRLRVNLVFPGQEDSVFSLDLELRGIIIVEKATARMFGTKVEITMPKAEPGSWSQLNFTKISQPVKDQKGNEQIDKKGQDSDSDVDLDDIEPAQGVTLLNVTR